MPPWTMMKTITTMLALVVRFDGSLRCPIDPGYSNSKLGKLASCAACVYHSMGSVDKELVLDEYLVSSQSKLLHANDYQSSAEVEYEGLLFALETIKNLLRTNDDVRATIRTLSVIIQGDCKTVMSQMLGRSRPRKLENYYHQAMQVVQEKPCEIIFEHIPREYNVLADKLCRNTIVSRQQEVYTLAQSDLERIALLWSQPECINNSRNESSFASGFINQHFGADTSLIPHSLRLELLRRLAAIACKCKQGTDLIVVGEFIVLESNVLSPLDLTVNISKAGNSSGLFWVDKSTLIAEGVVYQSLGLRLLDNIKGANTLEQKYRHLLSTKSKIVQSVHTMLAQ
jgi:ribonuclease HI